MSCRVKRLAVGEAFFPDSRFKRLINVLRGGSDGGLPLGPCRW